MNVSDQYSNTYIIYGNTTSLPAGGYRASS